MYQTKGLDKVDVEAAREGNAEYKLRNMRPQGIKPKKQRGLVTRPKLPLVHCLLPIN